MDILVATPGRLLDHFQQPLREAATSLEVLVLDEADRMLDMGFLPDVRRVLSHLPAKPPDPVLLGATLPPPIVVLVPGDARRSPSGSTWSGKSAPAAGITQAVYPVSAGSEALSPRWSCCSRGEFKNALVFTRTKHRANRLAEFLTSHGRRLRPRMHGNRSQAQRTDALARFKDGRLPVLVATDIAARGIDVEALGHVVNFDVPKPAGGLHPPGRPYRPRRGRRATPSPSSRRRKRGTSPPSSARSASACRAARSEGFDYSHKPTERFEIPIGERIAAIRARKAEERARAKAKAERKAQNQAQERARLEKVALQGGPAARPAARRSGRSAGRRPLPSPGAAATPPRPAAAALRQARPAPARWRRRPSPGCPPRQVGGGGGEGGSNSPRPWFLPDIPSRTSQPPAEPSGTVTDRERKIAQTLRAPARQDQELRGVQRRRGSKDSREGLPVSSLSSSSWLSFLLASASALSSPYFSILSGSAARSRAATSLFVL